jgi:hypothetical protein
MNRLGLCKWQITDTDETYPPSRTGVFAQYIETMLSIARSVLDRAEEMVETRCVQVD